MASMSEGPWLTAVKAIGMMHKICSFGGLGGASHRGNALA